MAATPNYSLSIYDSSDTDVRFLDFRVAIAGTQTTSNFYVIDGALKEHSDAINTLKNSPQAYIVKANFASGVYNASVSGFPGYKTNQLIVLSLNQTNTGAVSININNSSAKNVMLYNANGIPRNFIAGEFVSNSPALCYYDGTQFVTIGIPRGSATYVDGERGDVLQISSDGAIESSGKQIGNPNGIATLDSDGKVEQVAKIADGAASGEAVYGGNVIEIPYVSENRIASITAYGENAQGGTTEAPVALTGVDSVQVCGNNLLPMATETKTIYGVTFTPNSNGSITVSGTATGGIATYNFADGLDRAMLDQTVFVSGAIQLVKVIINEKTAEGAFARNVIVDRGQGASGILTKQKDSNILYATLQVQNGDTVNHTIYPMLNLGSTAMPYEPYQSSVTTLPIPRALHEVGDVRDVCRTRVKSVYDKRIVLNGSEGWKQSGAGVTYLISCNDIALGNHIESSYLMAKEDDALYSREVGIAANSKNGTIRVYLPNNANPTTFFASNPLTVYYQSTSYNGTNGLDVCLTEYQTGFVELDGTENWSWNTSTAWAYIATFLPNNKTGVAPVCSHYQGTGAVVPAASQVAINELGSLIIKDPSWQSVEDAKAYLAAQKAAGTPVQVAYQLATPEVYATDPVDFNNDAGPLTVITGGQVEVKMTDFVTDRTPAFLNKLDKTGDGSDVTVTFTEATEDADIASSDKLSILFGKILKRFSTITSKFTTVEGDISDIVDGTTTVANATTAATADKVKNKLSLLSGGGQDTIIYDGSTAIAAAMNSSFIGAEPAFIKNSAFNKNFGSSAGTVCQGNDGRLSDARRSSNISMSLSGANLSISYS